MISKKLFHLVVMAINLAMGLISLACGIWFHASKEVYSYMSIFVLSQNDKLLVAAAGIMLAIGFFLTLFCVFGIISIIIEKLRGFYKLALIGFSLIMILAFIAGFLPVGLRYDIFRFVKGGMKNQLKTYYEQDSKLGMEWNRVQVKKRCCGIDGVWDYENTNWFNSANPDADNPQVFVPPSCCTLNFNQEREITWVDPQNLQLRDPVRCQEDARGRVANTANVHNKGCFVALFSKNPDLWHDQTIWVILDVISGVCLTTAVLQIVVLVATSLVPLNEQPSQRYRK